MKSKILYLLFATGMLSLIGLPSCSKKEDNGKCGQTCLQSILKEGWAGYAQEFHQKNIGIAIYIKSKQAAYFESYGFKQNFTRQTQIRGASTTKSFTGAAILKLYQEHKLNIDDKITANIPGTNEPYLPNTPEYAIPHKEEITIRMLLDHRAGVFDVTNTPIPSNVSAPYAGQFYVDYILALNGGHHDFTKEELLKPVVDNQLEFFPPDSAFHYSNTGFGLLGIIVERVSGLPLDQYQKMYLIDPMQLKNTYMAITEAESNVPQPRIDNYVWVDGQMITNFSDNLSSAQADGNIITTVEDLGTWAYGLWGTNKVLNAPTLKEMTTMLPTHEAHQFYGLACEGGPPEIGHGHNGARAGTMVIMRYDPKSKAAYILATNFLNAENLEEQGNVMDKIMASIQEKFRP
jgi:D-alanyl-D-alanine carboxypeptidase